MQQNLPASLKRNRKINAKTWPRLSFELEGEKGRSSFSEGPFFECAGMSWRSDSSGSVQREHLGRFPPAPRREYLQVVRHDGAAVGAGEPTPEDGSTSQREPVLVSMTGVSPLVFPTKSSPPGLSLFSRSLRAAADPLRFSCRTDPRDDATAPARSTHPASSPGSSRIQTEVGSAQAQAGGAVQPHLVSIDSSWIA